MKQIITSCIIPFFNEGKRMIAVLEIVSKVHNCDQIICVDDGSTDNTSSTIIKKFPQVELIRLSKNFGKTTAVEKGLNLAKGSYILMLDGDLKNLKPMELAAAIDKILKSPAIDMIVLRRSYSLFIVKLLRGDVILSGERVIKKNQLREVLYKFKPKRYEIEVAINQYMIKNKKRSYWINSSALNTHKTEKFGLWEGIEKDFFVTINLLYFIGFFNYVWQIFFFCKNSA